MTKPDIDLQASPDLCWAVVLFLTVRSRSYDHQPYPNAFLKHGDMETCPKGVDALPAYPSPKLPKLPMLAMISASWSRK